MMNTRYIITPTIFALLSFTGFAQTQTRSYSKADTLRDSRGNIAGISTFEYQITEGNPYQDRLEQIKVQKVSFFNYCIGFTTKEAQTFWPLYDEYVEKIELVLNKRKKLLAQLTSTQLTAFDEKTLKKNIDDLLQYDNELIALKLQYYKRISEVLPPIKMARFYLADEEFPKRLLRALKSGW